jgi:hypothetical protein
MRKLSSTRFHLYFVISKSLFKIFFSELHCIYIRLRKSGLKTDERVCIKTPVTRCWVESNGSTT